MTSQALRTAALALAAAAAPAYALEEVLTPASYFECQIAARQATIVGLQERVQQSGRKDLSEADKRAAADRARERVTLAMYACGQQNAATLGAYAHRHAEALQTYLNANPSVKGRLDALGQRIAALSQQMPAVSASAKR